MALVLTAAVGTAAASAVPWKFEATQEGKSKAATINATTSKVYFVLGSSAVLNCYGGELFGNLSASSETLETDTNFPCAVSMNTCKFIFHAGEKGKGTLDIGGAKCVGISILDTNYPSGFHCKATIPAQTGLTTVTYENLATTPAKVSIAISASLKIVGEGGGLVCPKGETYGAVNGTFEAKAFNEASTQIDLSVSPLAGLYLEGGEFKGESYPLPVAGSQSKTLEFTASPGVGTVKCTTAKLSTTLSAAASLLSPVSSETSDCYMTILGVKYLTTTTMNSCSYVLKAGGTMDIACTKGGDAIEFKKYSADGSTLKCTITVAAQEGLEGVTFTNIGTGHGRGVEVGFNVKTITDTTSGTLLGCGVANGSHSNGTLTGTVPLYGVQ